MEKKFHGERSQFDRAFAPTKLDRVFVVFYLQVGVNVSSRIDENGVSVVADHVGGLREAFEVVDSHRSAVDVVDFF